MTSEEVEIMISRHNQVRAIQSNVLTFLALDRSIKKLENKFVKQRDKLEILEKELDSDYILPEMDLENQLNEWELVDDAEKDTISSKSLEIANFLQQGTTIDISISTDDNYVERFDFLHSDIDESFIFKSKCINEEVISFLKQEPPWLIDRNIRKPAEQYVDLLETDNRLLAADIFGNAMNPCLKQELQKVELLIINTKESILDYSLTIKKLNTFYRLLTGTTN